MISDGIMVDRCGFSLPCFVRRRTCRSVVWVDGVCGVPQMEMACEEGLGGVDVSIERAGVTTSTYYSYYYSRRSTCGLKV
jgi:hypothetical protein